MILLFDLAASLLSKALAMPYGAFSIGSFVIYFLVGLLVARATDLKMGMVAAAETGLVEATLGWAISWLVGVGRLSSEELPPAAIVATVIGVILSAAVVGLIGALIGRKLGRRATVAGGA